MSSARRQRCIDHTVRMFGVSERLACRVLGQHRSTQRKAPTRECLAIRIDRKLKSTDVIDVSSDFFIVRGVPGHVRSDNGPEFIAKAVRE